MRNTWQHARALVAALAMGACLALVIGCGTTASSRDSRGKTATGPIPEGSPLIALTPEQYRHAEALAHFATGITQKTGEDALKEFRQSLDLDPKNPLLAVLVAKTYLDRRDNSNAVAVLETTVHALPDSADTWYALGVAYHSSDQTQKAIDAWRQTIKLEPTHQNAVRILLEVYAEQGAVTNFTGVLQPALKQTTTNANYWVNLGDALTAVLRRKPSMASLVDRATIRRCFEKALAIAPRDLEIQARVADAYIEVDDYKSAADAYAKLLAARPDNPQILERLWHAYVRSDQKEKAIATLELLVKRDPTRSDLYSTLGDLYEDADQTEKALSNYQAALVVNPNQLDLHVHVAMAQMKLKQFDEAGKTLDTAREKFPTKYQVPYLVGLLQSDLKNFTNALASFADAEVLAREDPEQIKLSSTFYFSYGSAYERTGNSEKAAAMFRKAIELDPNNHNACNYLGYMWADQGVHLQESLELIQKANTLEPDNGAYLDSLGWVLYRLGRTNDALPPLKRAVEILKKEEKQEDATVLDHLAEVLLKLGKRDEAVDALRRANQADPGNKDIADKLQKYTANHTAAPTSPAVPRESPTP